MWRVVVRVIGMVVVGRGGGEEEEEERFEESRASCDKRKRR